MPDVAAPPAERLFLALWPDAAQRERLQHLADEWLWPEAARRTRVERLHVTLHFLGAVPAPKAAALRQAPAVRWPGCELLFDRASVWPGGIAVLEATQVPAALQGLHAALGGLLEQLEIPVEQRRYRPHVTLARKAVGARPPAGGQPFALQAGPAYVLVRTLGGGRGYEVVQAFG
jgi:2'-5' RNA ligase